MNNGGQAFPHTITTISGWTELKSSQYQGMSLRDYFAAKATEEDIEAHRAYNGYGDVGQPLWIDSREEAKYKYADAMLKAREESK